MEKMKNYFSKRKKIVAAALCAASLVTAIGAAGVASAARPGPNNKADAVTSATTRAKQGGESGKTAVPAAVQSNIGENRAKEIALKHAGLAAEKVTFSKTELEKEEGPFVYDVEFYTADTEYEYEIDAAAGTVCSSKAEPLERETDAVTGAATHDSQNGQTAQPAVQSNIGESRAKEIALKHAGLAASQVGFEKTKLENEDGRAEYEIEFYSDEKEYEYTIDALNGNILEQEIDQRD